MSKLKKSITSTLNVYLDNKVRGAYRQLEGELLTLIDATFTDAEQRKAQKDIVKQKIWDNWYKRLQFQPYDWLFIDLANVLGDKEYVSTYEKYCKERPEGNIFKS